MKKKVVLRDVRDQGGARYLGASLNEAGDLVIEGHDLGPGVEEVFGESIAEYEWIWTVQKANVTKLAVLLGPDVLKGLEERFNEPNADKLYGFLQDNSIPFERFSRMGE